MVQQDGAAPEEALTPTPTTPPADRSGAAGMADELTAPLPSTPPPLAAPCQQAITKENPFLTSNFFSRETYSFINPLMSEGYSNPLMNSSLYGCLESEKSAGLSQRITAAWEKEQEKPDPSLTRALLAVFGFQYLEAFTYGVLEWTAGVLEPYIITNLFEELRKKDDGLEEDEGKIWMYTGIFLGLALVRSVIHHPFFGRSMLVGMRCRVACTALIYNKVLRMSSGALSEATTGRLVNLISNDTERFDQAMPFLPFLIIGPIKVAVVAYLVYLHMDYPGLIGVGLCVATGPLQFFLGKAFGRLRSKTAGFTDKRVKVMNEVITGIRLIKMYAWEIPFAKAIRAIRGGEEGALRTTSYLRAVNAIIYFISPPLTMFLIISVYIHTIDTDKYPLTPAKVFASLMYINVMRISVGLFIPQAIRNGSELLVSLERIQEFLLCEEFEANAAEGAPPAAGPSGGDHTSPCIALRGVNATWPGASAKVFSELNLEVAHGELVGICGPVGAGKTSLFSLLTGELRAEAGAERFDVGARPTLASQEVWLISDTVRNNITFGREFDEERYEKVAEACGLLTDFEQFTDGDETVVGDRGITLSGGQKARIGLARACYEGGELFLLDDPLSAVDSVVGRHIVTHCINGILRGRTRILVTHQHQFLPLCDRVYEIQPNGDGILDRTEHFKQIGMEGCSAEVEGKALQGSTPPVSPGVVVKSPGVGGGGAAVEKKPQFEMISKEDRMTGSVTFRTYVDYFRNGGVVISIVMLAFAFLAQANLVWNDVWLTRWTDRPSDDKDNTFHFRYYCISVSVLVVLGVARALLFFRLSITASTKMHNKMFLQVVHSPCQFFDANPTGRVLNRFSKDVGQMDDLLPWIFFDCIQTFLICTGGVIIVSMFNPWCLIGVAPIVALFVFLRTYFIATGREVKRLEAQNRSPLYSAFSETVAGVGCIRAYAREAFFASKFEAAQDDHSSAFYLFLMCNRWIGLRLDTASWFFIAAVAISAVLARDSVSSGEVAVSITYASSLSGLAQWCIRQSAELENMMTATERVRLYGELPHEGGEIDAPPASLAQLEAAPREDNAGGWPSDGAVAFSGYSMRYREGLPLVLKDLTFSIAAGEKVGVVGRTGAGKSSLMQAIFRLSEGCGGAILIDGRATSEASLHELRSGCSVIPQDPVLFTGSLRYNVDPFGSAASDRVIWNALRDVQLQQVVEDLPGKLDFLVKEGGKNFSVGQRQLICLARAILRDNKVLVMDEATANVDPETDLVVQETVKRQFKDCTVITIAHRLHTVIESDRILVLARGQVMAYGDPHDLLQDDDGILTNFVEQTGDDTAASLRESARLASMRRSMSPVRVPY
eukprot:TRINITY_DN576_c0_g2_i2.p1 TRINITY_DN576_c0_g2~~TRINITY_DN576_c0_g2_i2.p1  ORF type:complete len:1346 (+),score=493.74 TRINITY_DN576_c0_g2_i2:2-4039(+)